MDQKHIWTLVGSLLSALLAVLMYWQVEQDKEIKAFVENIVKIFDSRDSYASKFNTDNATQDQQILNLQERFNRHEERHETSFGHEHPTSPAPPP